jgi:hypothetical protein
MSKKRSEYGGGYSERDARKDTGASRRDVSHSWHDARDDAASSGDQRVPEDRHGDDKKK